MGQVLPREYADRVYHSQCVAGSGVDDFSGYSDEEIAEGILGEIYLDLTDVRMYDRAWHGRRDEILSKFTSRLRELVDEQGTSTSVHYRYYLFSLKVANEGLALLKEEGIIRGVFSRYPSPMVLMHLDELVCRIFEDY